MTQCQATVKGTYVKSRRGKRCRNLAVDGLGYCAMHQPSLKQDLYLSVADETTKTITPKAMRKIRLSVPLSQPDISDILGVSVRFYTYRENGQEPIEPWLALAMVTLREIRGK